MLSTHFQIYLLLVLLTFSKSISGFPIKNDILDKSRSLVTCSAPVQQCYPKVTNNGMKGVPVTADIVSMQYDSSQGAYEVTINFKVTDTSISIENLNELKWLGISNSANTMIFSRNQNLLPDLNLQDFTISAYVSGTAVSGQSGYMHFNNQLGLQFDFCQYNINGGSPTIGVCSCWEYGTTSFDYYFGCNNDNNCNAQNAWPDYVWQQYCDTDYSAISSFIQQSQSGGYSYCSTDAYSSALPTSTHPCVPSLTATTTKSTIETTSKSITAITTTSSAETTSKFTSNTATTSKFTTITPSITLCTYTICVIEDVTIYDTFATVTNGTSYAYISSYATELTDFLVTSTFANECAAVSTTTTSYSSDSHTRSMASFSVITIIIPTTKSILTLPTPTALSSTVILTINSTATAQTSFAPALNSTTTLTISEVTTTNSVSTFPATTTTPTDEVQTTNSTANLLTTTTSIKSDVVTTNSTTFISAKTSSSTYTLSNSSSDESTSTKDTISTGSSITSYTSNKSFTSSLPSSTEQSIYYTNSSTTPSATSSSESSSSSSSLITSSSITSSLVTSRASSSGLTTSSSKSSSSTSSSLTTESPSSSTISSLSVSSITLVDPSQTKSSSQELTISSKTYSVTTKTTTVSVDTEITTSSNNLTTSSSTTEQKTISLLTSSVTTFTFTKSKDISDNNSISTLETISVTPTGTNLQTTSLIKTSSDFEDLPIHSDPTKTASKVLSTTSSSEDPSTTTSSEDPTLTSAFSESTMTTQFFGGVTPSEKTASSSSAIISTYANKASKFKISIGSMIAALLIMFV